MEMMAKSDQVLDTGKKIVLLSKDIDSLIESLYSKLDSLSLHGNWQGDSATKYLTKISSDKEEFKKLNNILKSYGEVLVNSGEKIDAIIKKYRGSI